MSSDDQSLSKYTATAIAVIFIFVVTSLQLSLLHHSQGLVVVSLSLWAFCYIPTQRHLPNGYDYMGKRYLVMDFSSVSTSITCMIIWLDPRIAIVGFYDSGGASKPLSCSTYSIVEEDLALQLGLLELPPVLLFYIASPKKLFSSSPTCVQRTTIVLCPSATEALWPSYHVTTKSPCILVIAKSSHAGLSAYVKANVQWQRNTFHNVILFSSKNLTNQISWNSRLNWITLWNAHSVSWSSCCHFHHGWHHRYSCPPHHGKGRTVQASALVECIVVVIRGWSRMPMSSSWLGPHATCIGRGSRQWWHCHGLCSWDRM